MSFYTVGLDRRTFLSTMSSAALTYPLSVHAQPAGRVRTVGILGHTSAKAFEQRLQELGWIEGKNVKLERRMSTDSQKLARFASELSNIPVDVIFAGNAPATRAAMEATRAIPIVTVSADPVGAGFVASLARPGANVTGVAIMDTELSGKRLEILTQALPTARRIAFLVNPTNPSTSGMRRATEDSARVLGVKLLLFDVSASQQLASTMAVVVKEHPDALIVSGDPLFNSIQKELIAAAARHHLPAMWDWRFYVEGGGLMSYGP